MRKKLYLLKYEVIATSIKQAMKSKGTLYEVTLTEEKSWPIESKNTGFKVNEKTKS